MLIRISVIYTVCTRCEMGISNFLLLQISIVLIKWYAQEVT